jgi:ribonuclease D
MVEYAVKDTALLIALYGELVAELAAAGRLAWVEEENELLSRVRASARNGEMLSLRFKGASRMDSRTLAVLEELLRFRDERARQNDLPPFKVLGAETLAELAHKKPAKSVELSGIVGMTPKLLDRYGNQLLAAVASGMALPANRLPSYPRSPGPVRNPHHDRLLKQLKLWRDGKSRSLGVDAGLLANNTLLEALCAAALENHDELETLPMLKRWQNEVFGGELKELLIKAREQARTF